MTKATTYISLFVVILILLYWLKKRPQTKQRKCAEVWDKMDNILAEQFFFNAMTSTENDPDLKKKLEEDAAGKQQSIDYINCLYSAEYVYKQNKVSKDEMGVIQECMCKRLK